MARVLSGVLISLQGKVARSIYGMELPNLAHVVNKLQLTIKVNTGTRTKKHHRFLSVQQVLLNFVHFSAAKLRKRKGSISQLL
jgi:hypothetical protein